MDMVAAVKDQIEWVEADILDVPALEEAMKGIRQVYHCAALISFDPRDARKMRQINQTGTENVVNIALHSGVEKLVHVSSIAAIGRRKNGSIISEKTKWERSKFNSNYAISKHLAEQEVWRGMAEGLDVGIVNPSVIIGSGRWDEGPLKLFKLGWKNYPFFPKGASGFVDVRDVARFMIRLMESDISGERFILNSGNCSFKQIQFSIAEALDRKKPYLLVSPLVQQIAWRLEWLRARLSRNYAPLITRETAEHSSRVYYYDNQKSIESFNFEYIPVEQTIAETSRQFIQASNNGFTSKYLPLY